MPSICGDRPSRVGASPFNHLKGVALNTTSISSSITVPARDFQVFDAGNVLLQSGRTFRKMTVAYKAFGVLNGDKSNVIVYPTSYSAQHYDTQFMVGVGAALDPSKYFIIIPNLFGNGLSSSPSNTPWPDVGSRYPNVTCFDAVHVQRRMLRELWGIEKVALVYGWSMGAMQAYHWAALFPEAVERIAVVCGAARCAPHNHVFIEGVKHALMADPAFRDGVFIEPERKATALNQGLIILRPVGNLVGCFLGLKLVSRVKKAYL